MTIDELMQLSSRSALGWKPGENHERWLLSQAGLPYPTSWSKATDAGIRVRAGAALLGVDNVARRIVQRRPTVVVVAQRVAAAGGRFVGQVALGHKPDGPEWQEHTGCGWRVMAAVASGVVVEVAPEGRRKVYELTELGEVVVRISSQS